MIIINFDIMFSEPNNYILNFIIAYLIYVYKLSIRFYSYLKNINEIIFLLNCYMQVQLSIIETLLILILWIIFI